MQNEIISAWMRENQRKSARARWSKLTPAQRSEIMRRVRMARKKNEDKTMTTAESAVHGKGEEQ